MSDAAYRDDSRFRLRDLLVILLCLFVAAGSLYLFRMDLYRTLGSRNEEPVGKIKVKKNIVQRRLADRTLWDRLFDESPVYEGDTIRVAQRSAATLNLDENLLDLSENTLIRIGRRNKPGDPLLIELDEGFMNINSGAEKIKLKIGGSSLHVSPGTVLNAFSGDESQLAVISGTVFEEDESSGLLREISAGSMLSLNDGSITTLAKPFRVKPETAQGYITGPASQIIVQAEQSPEASRSTQASQQASRPARSQQTARTVSVPQLPVLLEKPSVLSMQSGHRIGIEEIRQKRSLDFKWARVNEANAYIITIFQVTPQGRREIVRKEVGNTTSWTLDNVNILDRGNFVWQLEAVTRSRNGIIERHGSVAENAFTIDIPVPSAPSIKVE